MPWSRTGRGWWRLQVNRCNARVLEAVSEVPGVNTVARIAIRGEAHDVIVNAHRTAFFTEAMEAFLEEVGEAPEHLLARDDAPDEITLWTPTRPLRSYQRAGAEWLVRNEGGVLGDAMGIGKSCQAAVAAMTLRTHDDPILIIGPRFVREVWRREFVALGALTEEESEDGRTWYVCKGAKPPIGVDDLMAGARFVFIHYDILEGWRPVLTRPLRMRRPAVVIVDEAHWARNPKSKRGRETAAIVTMIPARIVLTGTPFVNAISDLWAVLTLAAGVGSWGTSFDFLSRYTHFEKGKYGYVSSGPRREAEFRGRLESCYLRRECTDPEVALELPPLQRELWMLDDDGAPMEAELKKYVGKDRERALHDLGQMLRRGAFGGETLTCLMAWRKWTHRQKLAPVAERVASLLAEGDSVVVFTWLRAGAEHLEKLITKAYGGLSENTKRIFVVHGGIHEDARDQTVKQFQSSTKPSVLISTNEALKEGVTLTRARVMFLVDLEWIPSSMMQMEKRFHRIGQTLACHAIWVGVRNSADDVVIKHLLEKADAERTMVGNTHATDAFVELGIDKPGETREETLATTLLAKWGGL